MKSHVNLTCESEVLEKAKNEGVNLSAVFEKALKEEHPDLTELPKNLLKTTCSICGKDIQEGFYCRDKNRIYCNKCGLLDKSFKGCPYGKEGYHEHKKFTS